MLKNLTTAILLTLAASSAYACKPGTERCKTINNILELMEYQSAIAQVQMACRGKAAAMHPEQLRKSSPHLLMGVLPASPKWSQVVKAHEDYIEEACGGDEVVYLLLGGYQAAWDAQTPGAKVGEVLEKVKKGGKGEVVEDARVVTERVNQIMQPLLTAMVNLAQSNFAARMHGIVVGELNYEGDGQSCTPTEEQSESMPDISKR